MKKTILILFVFMISCTPQNKKSNNIYEQAFPNLSFEFPVDIQSPKDGTNRIFVLSQPGVIYVFDNNSDTKEKKIFLDIREKVLYGGELGLLGLAFHPNYKENGFFYLDYTTRDPMRTVISRFQVSGDDPSFANASSEVILLEVEQPFENHNGGQISFGPDGYLYISLGDGGSAGDPHSAGQDLKNMLAKMLRIDVDKKADGKNYSIPADNPFIGNSSGYKEEIYAYGLRNVWRFSFDKENRLWAADVGQNKWEEINLVEKGKNYGWRIMEAKHCYDPENNCDTTGLVFPIWEYGHNDMGGFSITGGFVYEGESAPALKGKYIYDDYVSGRIWQLEFVNKLVSNKLLIDSDLMIATFGIDESNELYFADYKNGGKLYKFVVD